MSEFALRPMRDTDLGFIYKSWSEGLYDSEPYCHINRDKFRKRQRCIMDAALEYCTTLVVSPPSDPDTILGWICCDRSNAGLVVHWVYTRNVARRGGIGRLLLAASGWRKGETILAPQWGRDLKWIGKLLPVEWAPWVCE